MDFDRRVRRIDTDGTFCGLQHEWNGVGSLLDALPNQTSWGAPVILVAVSLF